MKPTWWKARSMSPSKTSAAWRTRSGWCGSSSSCLSRSLMLIPSSGSRLPRGIIFYGPPGTGKTHLARAVANEIGARFFFINGTDIIGTLSGETEGNLRRMFNEAAHHAPSIVIIDEVDAIAPKRGQSGTLSDTRAVTALLSAMDGMQKVEGSLLSERRTGWTPLMSPSADRAGSIVRSSSSPQREREAGNSRDSCEGNAP